MLGASLSGEMCRQIVGAHMHWAWYIILPLSVWSIYTLDHLLDARRLGDAAHTPRHLFHHHHFRPLAILVGVFALLCLGMALVYLGQNGVVFGLGMTGIVVIHLLLVKLVGDKTAPWLIKEVGVALVYAAGIWGLPVIEAGAWDSVVIWLLFLQFFFLALINLLEFSWYEQQIDALDGHTSFVRAIGERGAQRVLYALFGGLGALMLLAVLLGQGAEIWGAEGLYLAMSLVLLGLLLRPGYFGVQERYRAWGDGAFLLPGIYILLAWLV